MSEFRPNVNIMTAKSETIKKQKQTNIGSMQKFCLKQTKIHE